MIAWAATRDRDTLWERSNVFALVEELSSSLPLNKAVLCPKRSGDKERQKPCKHVWREDTNSMLETGTGWLWDDWETYKNRGVNNVKAEREDWFGHYQMSQNSIIRNMGQVNEQWLPGKQFTPSCQVFKSFMCCRLIASYLLSLWISPTLPEVMSLPVLHRPPMSGSSTLGISTGCLSSASQVTPCSRKSLVMGSQGFFSVPFALPQKGLTQMSVRTSKQKDFVEFKHRYKILIWKCNTMPCLLESKVRNVSDFDGDYSNTQRICETEVGTVLL